MAQAYGFNQLSLGAALGSGQTIAIVDAYSDPNIAADLSTFDSQFGLSNPQLTIVNQNGNSTSRVAENPDWDVEISLDVEWAHAMAPGANILLVEANSDSFTNLLAAVNTGQMPPESASSPSPGGPANSAAKPPTTITSKLRRDTAA